MSKPLPPGLYNAQITSFMIGEIEAVGLVSHFEIDYGDLERRTIAHTIVDWSGWLDPVNEELDKQRKLHPTKAIHSNEPWKAKAKRQGRQIRKSK